MNIEKKTVFVISLFFNTLSIASGMAFVAGCALSTPVTREKSNGTPARAREVMDTVPEQYQVSIEALAQRVDSLRERFMMMPGGRQVTAGLEKQWSLLSSEAQRLRKAVCADGKLGYLLGELGRIGIFFNVPDAAHTAEYYLSECVGLAGGSGGGDFRPYLSLAWLNLHNGCQLSEKTFDLLIEAEKRIPDWEVVYLSMLWGYYYYFCRRDPEKALPCFQRYLAFDPYDERAVKVYQNIKREVTKE